MTVVYITTPNPQICASMDGGRKAKNCDSHVTFLGCVSQNAKPIFSAYAGKKGSLNQSFFKSHHRAQPTYYKTASGWISTEVLILWFLQVIIPYIQSYRGDRPVLLVMDCHVSRLDPEFRDLLKSCNVDMLLMHSLCTPILQPFKNALRGMLKGPSVEESIYYREMARSRAAIEENIVSGWNESRLLSGTPR